jgi:tetratricopeptide (TPR) repeat protein
VPTLLQDVDPIDHSKKWLDALVVHRLALRRTGVLLGPLGDRIAQLGLQVHRRCDQYRGGQNHWRHGDGDEPLASLPMPGGFAHIAAGSSDSGRPAFSGTVVYWPEPWGDGCTARSGGRENMGSARNPFGGAPDPESATSLDDLVEFLRSLKVWAGNPSFERLKNRVNAAWTAAGLPARELVGKTTVADCFRAGRRRVNAELVVAIVEALHPDPGYAVRWRQALRVIAGEADAAAQVRVQDVLPDTVEDFTGRVAELERLRWALRQAGTDGAAVVVSAIEGMAGVGKTQLALYAARLLSQERQVDRVLFVNLRGFHADPVQPPADPGAVLDAFLRLLGVPGQGIPHSLDARVAAYRDRLSSTRTLVVLDNAASADQVRPLLPDTPGCPALVTSRRDLAGLRPAVRLTLDVFTPEEALRFLAQASSEVLPGPDPRAPHRIVQRCGNLPLAMGLVAGHIRTTSGWTLTDHADRLDERHRDRRLDTGVQVAFDVSYQALPPNRRRLLRLLALHPGPYLDTYGAAALADTDLHTATAGLDDLARYHLLQPAAPGRFSFHDLVRAYAVVRAGDEDPPAERHAALTRLFDYYLACAAAAMDTLHAAESHRRPQVAPARTPMPVLTDPDGALAWLDTERATLTTVTAHTAGHGRPAYAIRLSGILARYIVNGHLVAGLTIHSHALRAARDLGDSAAQAEALVNLGSTRLRLGEHARAADHLRQALVSFSRCDDPGGRARALANLGFVAEGLGDYRQAVAHIEDALVQFHKAGDRFGEAAMLSNLGIFDERAGNCERAAHRCEQALSLYRSLASRTGEAHALLNLGGAELRLGRHDQAARHLHRARVLCRRFGNHNGEAESLTCLGALHLRLERPDEAVEYYRRALDMAQEFCNHEVETDSLNGLGESARALGRPGDAATHHAAARDIAAEAGIPQEEARAHAGLGHSHRELGDPDTACRHYARAAEVYAALEMPEATELRALAGRTAP